MRSTVAVLERAIRGIPDPEIPVVTIGDLGMVRTVDVDEAGGRVEVSITPTYSGCPALEVIAEQVRSVAAGHGFLAQVVTVLSPAWTTDWVTPGGRAALQQVGIAPPAAVSSVPLTVALRRVRCPRCGSSATEETSAFGPTACTALRRCLACGEPFEEFKPL